uniref:C2H2-type domain-containing protein n=1 Tax=Nothobranchius furzeri TaxID=105023 RepID=A0A8C6L491_NOTFU
MITKCVSSRSSRMVLSPTTLWTRSPPTPPICAPMPADQVTFNISLNIARQPPGPGGTLRFEIKEEQGPGSGSGQPGGKEPGPLRECGSGLERGGLDGQKPLLRTSVAGRGDVVSPGRAEDSAGPSAPDTSREPSADRPHHCLECGKTFRLISSLKKHIRIHTGEKPYPCGVCGRRFRESGALKTHLRIHTGEKPYSCSECGNCFRHLDGLRKHRRTHTGEKPYVCAICGKRLSRLQHLKHHQLIHTGERPCCCPFCNRTFKEPAALRKHVRTHREEGGHMGIDERQRCHSGEFQHVEDI